MRVRQLSAVALVAVCVAALSSCHSNVGAAATIDGHRISESDVAAYLTPAAQPVPQQDQTTGAVTQVPARSWVLSTLLNIELYTELFRKTPGGAPSDSQLAAAQTTLLQGTSPDAVIAQYVQHGFTRGFATVYLREQSIRQVLSTEVSAGLDVQKLVDSLGLHVSVNPRYGAWDPSKFALSSTPGAGVPPFLTLKPDSAPLVSATPTPTN